MRSDHAFHSHVGESLGGGSMRRTLPYAHTYEPTLHTFVGTQRCQLYQPDVVVIQLAALGSYKGFEFCVVNKLCFL